MAETISKRQREETLIESEETKRKKSFNQILSFLDDEEEPTQNLSQILTTFQQQLSSDFPDLDPLPEPTQETDPFQDFTVASSAASECSPNPSLLLEEEGDEKEKVIRLLLEASDDELGIPSKVDGGDLSFAQTHLSFDLCDGLWEIEDEAANYYTLLQSELFM